MSSIVSKIKKLLALSQSPNENEAAAAAAMAQELLIKHNLAMSDVPTGEEPDEPMSGESVEKFEAERTKSTIHWRRTLMRASAAVNFCKSFRAKTRDGVVSYIVGKPTNRDAAVEVYSYLTRVVNDLGTAAVKSYYGYDKRAYGNAFRTGCADRLYERMIETLKKTKEQGVAGCTAIVVADAYRREDAAIERYFKDSKIKLVGGTGCSISNGGGYEAGRQAAEGVNFNRSARIARSSAPQLGTGR